MAKGAQAKEALIKRFITAVGNDYAGTENDKDYYFWSQENGERVQIKVSMTCPKTPIAFNGNGGDLNFEDDGTGGSNSTPAAQVNPMKMDDDEKATLERLMKELDL